MEISINSVSNTNSVSNPTFVGTASYRNEAKPKSWGIIQGCKSFPNPVTVSEAIKDISANYEVTKQPLVKVSQSLVDAIKEGKPYTGLSFSKNDIIETHMCTYREDTHKILGVVGANYGVVQNSKAFEFIDIITSGKLGGDKPVIETAGILGYGERMFVTAKMPEQIRIDGDDNEGIDDYILFTNSHDGSGAVTALFTPIRVICQNSLNLALKKAKNKLIFKHTLNVNARLDWENNENMEKAVAVLKMHKKYKEEFLANLSKLSSEKITDKQIMNFAVSVMANDAQTKLFDLAEGDLDKVDEIGTRTKNNILSLRDCIESGVGQNQFKGTKLWLYNGLTSYLNNVANYRGDEEKMNSLVLGGTANKKMQKGFDYLMAI